LPDQLTEASAAGNVEQIEKLVKAGTNPNATNTSGQTPLQLAAVSGRFEAVKSLLALGADVCIKTNILQPGGEKLIDLLNRINSATDRDIASNQDLEKMRRAIASQDCGGHFDQAKFQKALSSDE
jgi:ankyrin repeat protein